MKISKELFKKIKKYNREDMYTYVEGMYRSGFEDGVESGIKADILIALIKILDETKGVGKITKEKAIKTYKRIYRGE